MTSSSSASRSGSPALDLHVQQQRREPLLRAVVEVALEPPSLVVRRAHDPGARGTQLAHTRLEPRLQALVLQPQRCRAAGCAHDRRVVGERRVVDQRSDSPAVRLDLRDGARRVVVRKHHGAAFGIDPAAVVGDPVDDLERRIAKRLGQRLAERGGAGHVA